MVFAALLVAQAASSTNADDAFAHKDYARAKALYQAQIASNPKDSHALYRVAWIDAVLGDSRAALADLEAFSNAVPIPVSAYRTEGFAQFAKLPGFDRFLATLERTQYACRYDAPARAMDRWIGTWKVTDTNGPGGSSDIDRDLEGCAIVEHWRGAYGETGTSLTSYDASNHVWLQHYVTDRGNATDYVGRVQGASIVFDVPASPASAKRRMTYTFLKDGRVEQRFETSDDAGKTWVVGQDLIYARAAAEPR